MKRVKIALAFVCAGLLAITVWAGYEMGRKNPTVEKEEAPVVYSIVQYTDLFILDGAPHTKHFFVDVNLNGRLVHKDDETHTIVLQDLDNKNRYLRADVPKEKWAKVRTLSINQNVYVIGFATRLTYFNDPIIEVRDIGKI